MRIRIGVVATMVVVTSAALAGPRQLTYQGSLVDADGQAVPDGTYDMRFRIYDDPLAGTKKWEEIDTSVPVRGGLCSTILGDGRQFGNLFNWNYSLWLEVAVDLDGNGFDPSEVYMPRQRMTSAAWAVDSDLLQGHTTAYFQRRVKGTAPAGQYIQAINADGSVVTAVDQDTYDWPSITGKPSVFPPSPHNHDALYWRLSGNAGTIPGTNFLGTTDAVALELHTNGMRTLLLDPTTTSPNIIAGHTTNTVTAGVYGATISGGGENSNANRVTDRFATVGGGRGNQAGNDDADLKNREYATVGGGAFNLASGVSSVIGGGFRNTAAGQDSTVAGGVMNTAGDPSCTVGGGGLNRAHGLSSVVSGGYDNLAAVTDTTISGGYLNRAMGYRSTIAGGAENATSESYATVSGGQSNTAGGVSSTVSGGFQNLASATDSTIGGGYLNTAAGYRSTIAGGVSNETTATYSTIGGGAGNQAHGDFATVSGGRANAATGTFATVSGGVDNASTASFTTVGGGRANRAVRDYATVSGGSLNTASADYATVGGGFDNASTASFTTIGGGMANRATSESATIGGGESNTADASYATVVGGFGNNGTGAYSTIAGGQTNTASNRNAAVGGGWSNDAGAESATVGGGYDNTALGDWATISGGYTNIAGGTGSTIGGGVKNAARGDYATVPGGLSNSASGESSFAAGTQAKANNQGSFAWADSTAADFSVNNDDRFGVRASGGVYLYTNGTLTAGVYVPAGGNAWFSVSDRDAKENFQAIAGTEVLEKVAALPISTWNYKSENASIRHMGPMAQDLYAAFGLGDSDKAVSTIDSDGVALAAIQGLYAIAKEKDAKIGDLERRLAEETARRVELETRMARIEARLAQAAGETE